MGQLAGLKRRKLALEMLGAAVQSGLNNKKRATSIEPKGIQSAEKTSTNRQRQEEEVDIPSEQNDENNDEGPVTKKAKTGDS